MRKSNFRIPVAVLLTAFYLSCSSKQEILPDLVEDCMPSADQVIDFHELFGRYTGTPMELSQDLTLLGYVASSDKGGNIFGSIYIQDALENPTYGLEVKTDLLESNTRFPLGAQVQIQLKGLWLGTQVSGMVLGSVRDLFGTPVMDRIPATATLQHVTLTCSGIGELRPRTILLDSIRDEWLHTMVSIENIEVSEIYTDSIFAQPLIESKVPLQSCNGSQIDMIVSGYSDFRDHPLPKGSGSVSGILLGGKNKYELLISSESDLNFNFDSCVERFPPVTSDRIIISEIADPENEPQARFLEIFNTGEESIDLKGWSIVRYTNANTEAGNPASLSGLVLLPHTTAVLSAWPETFQEVYGFPPDLVIKSNGPADSNGDDNMMLLDPFGMPIDVFGVPGEDGTATAHEFEDGVAKRRITVERANPEFNPEEWQISNDSGGNGTENRPHLAPEDFTPGRHED